MSVKLSSDFAKKVAETLGITARGVDQLFDFSEDKQGFFVARLKPQQFLDKKDQFRTMCALVHDLGGENYVQGSKVWKVPGPFAKKQVDTSSTPKDARSKPLESPRPEAKKGPTGPQEKPSGQGMDSQRTYKEPGNAVPAGPSGVTPRSVTDDKSKPPQTTVPIRALLSMPFQCRTNPDDPEMAELTESIKAQGVLQPILVRPKPNGLYEIVYGQRRARAAEKAGLVEVPVTIRFLSDEEAFTLQLTENLQRKDLSEEEKTRALGELAKRTGWNAQQIADKLKMSERWVYKYLPGEFKQPEPEQLASARRALSSESQESGQGIPCARCGDPIQGPPVHVEDKFYCAECHEQIEAEKVPGLLPEPEHVGEAPEQLHEPMAPPAKHNLEPEGPTSLLTGFEVECPECHVKLLINHVDHPNGKVTHEVEE